MAQSRRDGEDRDRGAGAPAGTRNVRAFIRSTGPISGQRTTGSSLSVSTNVLRAPPQRSAASVDFFDEFDDPEGVEWIDRGRASMTQRIGESAIEATVVTPL